MWLWCCRTPDAAHDEFYRSAPPRRPRRLSAPPRVTRTPTPNITLKSPPQNGEQYIPIPVEQPDRGTNTNATPLPPSGDAIGTVTTPTISVRPSIKIDTLLSLLLLFLRRRQRWGRGPNPTPKPPASDHPYPPFSSNRMLIVQTQARSPQPRP